MSVMMHLTCLDCNQTILIGQHANSVGWYTYHGGEWTTKLNRFVNDHVGHKVTFQSEHDVPHDSIDPNHHWNR